MAYLLQCTYNPLSNTSIYYTKAIALDNGLGTSIFCNENPC